MAGLVPLLEKYKVAAGFFGHDHTYQHYLKDGIHYVTSGGGGAPLYDVNSPPEGITQKVVSIENFVMVSVKGKAAHVEAKSIDGAILDSFDIEQAVSGEGLPGTLGRPGDRLAAAVGHDTNLSNIAGASGLSWPVEGYRRDETSPGGALWFLSSGARLPIGNIPSEPITWPKGSIKCGRGCPSR
jgi:hypothetical protein